MTGILAFSALLFLGFATDELCTGIRLRRGASRLATGCFWTAGALTCIGTLLLIVAWAAYYRAGGAALAHE